MIIGIGTDIIEINRCKDLLLKDKGKIFTKYECEYLNKKNNSESIAGLFCAKEACIKALGGGYFLKDIEILHTDLGAPFIKNINDKKFLISISHCKDYATATVIAMLDI